MTNKNLPTINLKGKEYVMVKDRVSSFNDDFSNGSIKTEVIHQNDNIVAFRATVWPDVSCPERYFTGHSFGTTKEIKAFEKLETVAVGRALAFMGIGILDSVASADEMENFEKKQPSEQPTPGDNIRLKDGSLLRTGEKNGRVWYGRKKNGQMTFFDSKEEYDKVLLEEAVDPEVPNPPF